MTPEPQRWNVQLINQYLTEQQRKAIEQIPLSSMPIPDKFIWPHTKGGDLSVKSAYQQIKSDSNAAKLIHPQLQNCTTALKWRDIWAMATIPKVRFFLWRIINNVVAARANLRHRGMNVIERCPFCQETETAAHLLFQCRWTTPVWFATLHIRAEMVGANTVPEWFAKMKEMQGLVKEEKVRIWALIGMVSWAIWKERCRALNKSEYPNPHRTIQAAVEDHAEFWRCKLKQTRANGTPFVHVAIQWSRPPQQFIKINTDASWDERTKMGGVGGIARDESGEVVGDFGQFSTKQGSLELEVDAIYMGVELAVSKGWSRIIVDSDSREAIRCSSGEEQSTRLENCHPD